MPFAGAVAAPHSHLQLFTRPAENQDYQAKVAKGRKALAVLREQVEQSGADTMLINAAWGLGEGISQGEVAGDLYWVRRSTGELIASETGRATHRIELSPQGMGTVEVPLSPEQQGRPCLTSAELDRLASLARAVEETTGRAQDVEFGFDHEGGLVVFQMRRIVPRRQD